MDYKYFAFLDGEEKGPFSLSQLSDVGVRPSTYVWCKGMSDWQRADSVEEIKQYFKSHVVPDHSPSEPIIINPQGPAAAGSQPSPEQRPSSRPRFSRFGISEEDAPEPEPDLNAPPQVSMGLAMLSLVFFFPGAFAAIYYTKRAVSTWRGSFSDKLDAETVTEMRKKAHDDARLSKMWIGLSIALGIIFWTLIFSL